MKTIANVISLDEAQRIRIILGSAGIDIFIPDEIMAGLYPHHFEGASGVRVQVAEEDEEVAREILREASEEGAGTAS